MTDFTEIHSNLLFPEPWRVKDVSDISYLFKFHASDLGCCFLITDTKHVWVEVLGNRHISHRYRGGLGCAGDEIHHEDETWRAQRTQELVALHSPQRVESLECAVMTSTKKADLEVNLKLGPYRWRWETMSAGRMGADILSRHLIIPLITLNEFALKSPQSLSTMDDNSWTKHLDVVAKTSRVINSVHVLFRKPRVSTSLCRISQIQARAKSPYAVQSALSEHENPFPPMKGAPPGLRGEDTPKDLAGNSSPSAEVLRRSTLDDRTGIFQTVSVNDPTVTPGHPSASVSPSRNVPVSLVSSSSAGLKYSSRSAAIPRSRSPSPQATNRPTAPGNKATGSDSETVDAPVGLFQKKGKEKALRSFPLKNESDVTNDLYVKDKPRVSDPNIESNLKDDEDATEEDVPPAPSSRSHSRPLTSHPALPSSKRKGADDDDDDDSSDAAPPKSGPHSGGEVRGGWKGPRRAMTKKKRF